MLGIIIRIWNEKKDDDRLIDNNWYETKESSKPWHWTFNEKESKNGKITTERYRIYCFPVFECTENSWPFSVPQV